MPDAGYPTNSSHEYQPISLFAGAEWDGGGAQPAFWVDGFGMCHLRGRVTVPAGILDTPLFCGALPPPFDQTPEMFIEPGSNGLALVQVLPNPPDAAFLVYAFGDVAPDLWFDLSAITYPT
jgi:hypothetical protein